MYWKFYQVPRDSKPFKVQIFIEQESTIYIRYLYKKRDRSLMKEHGIQKVNFTLKVIFLM